MMKYRNTIKMVALSNNKKNKTRSRLIMSAVFLSTVLLTVLCTCSYGLVKEEKTNASLKYGSYYGICQSVTAEELREMERHGEFSKLGIMANAGMVESELNLSLMTGDSNLRDMTNLSEQLSEGSFPETENEIAAQKGFFEKAGYQDIHIGDKVTLNYRPDLKHKYEPREFTVSGILLTPEQEIPQTSFSGYVSMAFYEAQYTQENRKYSAAFQLADEIPVTYDSAEEVIKEIAADCGIDGKRVFVNTIYLLLTLNPGTETIFSCAVIAAAVILFSVIVIYNIFQVSIVQNIREYGKIRALGATKKQMRSLICYEGMFLAAFSIPAGVITGYAVSWAGFQWLIDMGNTVSDRKMETVSIFSPAVLLLAAGLAFLTVLLALHRPMKIVGSISPVDALRYMENTGSKKAGIRKGRRNLSVWSMAAANITADRKRTVMTILTMGLSCVLFVVLANSVGNMDAEYDARNYVERGQFQIELEYSLGDEAYPENNLDTILKDNPLNETFISQLRAIEGVTRVYVRNILHTDMNGRQETMAVLGKEDFESQKQHGGSLGRLEYEDSREQDIIYYCWSHFMEDNGYELGQKMTMQLENGTDRKSVNGVLAGAFGSSSVSWAVTEDMYERLDMKGASAGWLWVDCKPEDVSAVRAELENLLSGIEHVEMTAFEDALQKSKASIRILKMGCYLFLAMIGLIGFLNLANTMVMNIVTKKQEYGILQAVGMTKKQLNASLQIQGLLFSAGTVLVAVLVGLPAGYGFFCYARANAVFGLNVYHVPVVEIAGMIAAVGLLQAGLAFMLSRNVKKESLVERIRYQE